MFLTIAGNGRDLDLRERDDHKVQRRHLQVQGQAGEHHQEGERENEADHEVMTAPAVGHTQIIVLL